MASRRRPAQREEEKKVQRRAVPLQNILDEIRPQDYEYIGRLAQTSVDPRTLLGADPLYSARYFNRRTELQIVVSQNLRTRHVKKGKKGKKSFKSNIKVPRTGGRRYFSINVTVDGGTSLVDAVDKAMSKEKQRRNAIKSNKGWNYEDLDEGDYYSRYDIEDIRVLKFSGAEHRINKFAPEAEQNYSQDVEFDEDELEMSAFHQYQPNPLECFAIQPLLLRSFTCIYESLMVIKYHNEFGNKFPAILNDWRVYVLLHFQQEDYNTQQLFWDSFIVPCLKFFKQKYGIQVGLFNVYRYKDEMALLERRVENGQSNPQYYLAYWAEHVIPCTFDSLQMIVEHQDTKKSYLKDQSSKLFIIIPPIFNLLHLEVKCALIDEVDERGWHPVANDEGQFLFEQIPGFSLKDIYFIGRMIRKNPFDIAVQEKNLGEYESHMDYSQDDIIDKFTSDMQFTSSEKILGRFPIEKDKCSTLFFTPGQMETYNETVQLRKDLLRDYPETTEEQLEEIDEKLAQRGAVYAYSIHRRKQFFKKGRAVIDIETYVDNSEQRQTYYNMVPFCVSLVGELQQKYTEYLTDSDGNKRRVQRVRLVKGINKIFLGLHPKECMRKLVQYLLDNNFCYVQDDYNDLNFSGRGEQKQNRLHNYIFAHNGFGFDFRFLYEELHQHMREFKIVGDMNSTKQLFGNGLFFFDFSLIYREKLKNLAETFFPKEKDLHKIECDLVIDLQRETLHEWYDHCVAQEIPFGEHPKMKEIIEYCRQDSYVLFKIVNKFFSDAYSTPFGYGFLPKPFYHSLSQLAYQMFTNCYLTKPIFVNKSVLDIEQDTKMGGCTGTNCNRTGIGAFIDENSFYPAIMMNMMPVDYVNPRENSYELFVEPLKINSDNYQQYLETYNIYRIIFKFREDQTIPTICQKAHDTLIIVQQSDDYDTCQQHDNAKAIYVFGYSLMVAIEECEGTEIIIFGQIRFKSGDFIFKQFITDQYNKRLKAKADGDGIGDKFFKNVMNSAQGKLGQIQYDNVKFGSIAMIRDHVCELQLMPEVSNITVKQVLTDNIDLYELRWNTPNDKWLSQGNTVRLPSFIMSVARSQLLRVQNCIARAYGSKDVIAYYDTDSILTRFDITNPQLDQRVQEIFDYYLRLEEYMKSSNNKILELIIWPKFKMQVINTIGAMIENCREMDILKALKLQDVTCLHEKKEIELLDELRLGACKIEKYVIRSLLLGAKQYGVYYLEKVKSGWLLKLTVKLKGVKPEARSYKILNEIDQNIAASIPPPENQDEEEEEVDEEDNMLGFVDLSREDYDSDLLPCRISGEMTKWSRLGAGTIINKIRKLVRPTLTKRNHNVILGTSVPFKDSQAFLAHKMRYEEHAMQIKDKYKTGLEQLFIDIKSQVAYKQLQLAQQQANLIARQSKEYMKESIEALTESRKRYLIRIQKLKFEQLQDKVLEIFLQDWNVYMEAALYLQKLVSIAYMAVVNKRKTSRKGCRDLRDDRGQFTLIESARTIGFILFVYYIMKKRMGYENLNKNFVYICKQISKEFMYTLADACDEFNEDEEYVQTGKRLKKELGANDRNVHKWNYAVVYAFEFLQAGVCVYKNGQTNLRFAENDSIGQQFNDVENNYKIKTQYTSLWRFLNNMYEQLQCKFIDHRNNQLVIDENQSENFILQSEESLRQYLKGNVAFYQNMMFKDFDLYNLIKKDSELDSEVIKQQREQVNVVSKDIKHEFKMRPHLVIGKSSACQQQEEQMFADEYENKIAYMILNDQIIQASNENNYIQLENLRLFDVLAKHYDMGVSSDDVAETISSILCMQKSKVTAKTIGKDDIEDLIFFFSFLFQAKKHAAVLIKEVAYKIKGQYRDVSRNPTQLFVKTCRVLFCREQMFQCFLSKRPSQKTLLLFDFLREQTINASDETLEKIDDSQYIQRIIDTSSDRSKIPWRLHEILKICLNTQEMIYIGQRLYRHILKWRNPNPKMVQVLKAMVFIDETVGNAFIDDEADVKERVRELLANDEDNMMVTNIFQQQQSMLSREDSFIDDGFEEEKQQPKQSLRNMFDLVEEQHQQLSKQQEKRLKRNAMNVKEQDIDLEYEQQLFEEQLEREMYHSKRQKKADFFFEREAVESEGFSSIAEESD